MRTSYRHGQDLVRSVLDARDVETVDIDAGVADVEVVAGTADSIDVRVTLRSGDADRLERECLPNASLDARRDGRTLHFRVEQRTRDRCGAVWRVTLPSRLDVVARVSVGTVRISGTTGAVDASAQTGDVVVRSHASAHGTVSVRADVGRVRATVRGYEVPPKREHGPGATLTLKGSGGPSLDLRAGVGNATLDIAAP